MQRTRSVVAVIAATIMLTVGTAAARVVPEPEHPNHPSSALMFAAPSGVLAYLHDLTVHAYLLEVARAEGSTVGAPNEAHWLRIHNCEQPGDWYADGWTAHGHFQGGLGISTDAWAENDDGMPASALAATPYQQIIVAERIYARFGASAWACK